ncbi:histone acetyltransferase [[Haemophilus] ducreyi]|uniref:TDP-D-fucosamine acetyltransferase n=2 Tax=Haemophilus ducreyi TaxID=730 RepID=Q7VKN6_HAEDU|nr:dTDP-4-amino-4,6-dideoxy-D-galactose acyltransferase [[Haemophilus] ducreyi]AAP96586.1 putative TDP-D-fucosamine acetyltransferase [[Haemophilus] ducreyi 35000HP]AKO31432.1 histone acetyltransferase [[Haemophilus] ducreyi]AKO32886.1 histone acetyltransferase [[Haemophilus] ducreyi]AKO34333.1 histone acetyltransferase [[Haemophilus] ducreyi]AKO35777.1 histone acetyltransferase [[Haemophilus] ducreyi]
MLNSTSSTIISPDQWLSDFFGRPIVQVKVATADHQQIQKLAQQGLQLASSEIVFALPLTNKVCKPTTCQQATTCDLNELTWLFGQAFPRSRFGPPWFSASENCRFYQTWIRRAVQGEFDDLCLIQRSEDGQLQGGISLRRQQQEGQPPYAQVGLLAVDPLFQRQGVGRTLLQASINWALTQQLEHLVISTQLSNLNAINCYLTFNARVVSTHYWFYPRLHNDSF